MAKILVNTDGVYYMDTLGFKYPINGCYGTGFCSSKIGTLPQVEPAKHAELVSKGVIADNTLVGVRVMTRYDNDGEECTMFVQISHNDDEFVIRRIDESIISKMLGFYEFETEVYETFTNEWADEIFLLLNEEGISIILDDVMSKLSECDKKTVICFPRKV